MTLFNDLDTGEERVLMTSDIVNLLGLERYKINGNEIYPRIMMKLNRQSG